MKFLLYIGITMAACFVVGFFLPWWSIAVVAICIGYVYNNPLAFFVGAIGIGLVWLAMCVYFDFTTDSILTQKMDMLLPLPALWLTVSIGAIVGGMSAWSGVLVRNSLTHFQKK